jgi:uncharacterized protein involved in exopolysaccharide biosynthesis
MSLQELLAAARHSPWLVVGCVLLAALAAFGGSFLVTKTYTASVFVAPSSEDADIGGLAKQFSGIAGLAGGGPASGGKAERNLAILKSRAFTETFLRDSNFEAAVRARKGLRTWLGMAPRKTYSDDDLFRIFDQRVRQITVDSHTGFATITIEWSDPKLAADWGNSLVAMANARIRQKAIDEANRTLKFLDDEMAPAQVIELRQAISSLMASQMKTKMLATVRPEYAFTVLDPAVAAPLDRYTIPNRPLDLAAGAAAGLLVGLLFAVRRLRAAQRSTLRKNANHT